jgi:DNA polymerase-3 subunit beta
MAREPKPSPASQAGAKRGELLRVSLNRQELLTRLNAVVPACESGKTALPILKTVLLRLNDGVLELVATDLNILLRTTLPAPVIGRAAICVAGKLLQAVLAKLAEDTLQLVFLDEGLRLETASAKSKLAGLTEGSFPDFVEHEGAWLTLPNEQGQFAKMLELSLKTITLDESRYALAGALIELSASVQRVVSTNGHALMHLEQAAPLETTEPLTFLLPLRAVKEFAKLRTSTLAFAKSDNYVFVRAGELELRARLGTGTFPDYAGVLRNHPHLLKLEASAFLSAVKRMLPACEGDESGVVFHFHEDWTKCEARADGLQAEDEFRAERQGPPLRLKLSNKYLLHLYEEAPNAAAYLRYSTPNQSVEMNLVNALGFQARFIVMPMAPSEAIVLEPEAATTGDSHATLNH